MKAPAIPLSRASAGSSLVLEDEVGFTNDLIEIRTGAKQDSMAQLRRGIAAWLKNSNFERYQKSKIDIAIVIYVNRQKYRNQDCDNIAKLVLDAISNSKRYPKPSYLVENDSQVIRLLVYKIEQTKMQDMATDEVMISFRPHNPNKQMILLDQAKAQRESLAFSMKNSDSLITTGSARGDGSKLFNIVANESLNVEDSASTAKN